MIHHFLSTIPILVAINDELQVIAPVFLVVSPVALSQISQTTVQGWHETFVQVKVKILLYDFLHF